MVGPSVRRANCDVDDDETLDVRVRASDAREGRCVIDVRAKALPGTLRSLAWALNGLDLVAHECAIATDARGIVEMSFEVTERAPGGGERAVTDREMVRERLRDHLSRCTRGGEEDAEDGRLEEDGVVVDNGKNADSTFVSVRVPQKLTSSAILLYPIGNTFTGSGLVVKNGTLVKGADPQTGAPTMTWEFDIVRMDDRKKLNKDQLRPLMYTLALVCSPSAYGSSHAFTSR